MSKPGNNSIALIHNCNSGLVYSQEAQSALQAFNTHHWVGEILCCSVLRSCVWSFP